VFVKICGVRTAQDARACVDAGADAIGFNFWPGSRRYLRPADAARLVVAAGPLLRVGVFVEPTAAEVIELLTDGIIDVAQLHGDEAPAFGRELGRPYWKALRLVGPESLVQLAAHPAARFVLDAAGPGYGGSGRAADWTVAAAAARERSVLLAGGLTAANVARAIIEVRPFGVDVASGVEHSPGVKDARQIAAFVRAAREAEAGA
jgi:phosphoribosylanthranilate isomerase